MLFWLSYNPLLIEMCRCEESIYEEQELLIKVRSELAKYNADDSDYRERLVEEEHERYQQKFNEIKVVALDVKSYFRRRLAEILADPKAATILSANEFAAGMTPVEMIDISRNKQSNVLKVREKNKQ
jgi:hypothetical protein